MSPFLTIALVFMVLTAITSIILFVPFRWHRDKHFPPYSLHLKLKDHRIKHRPQINIEQCENNLETLDTVMKKHKLFYFLSEGTALGAKREQRLLPWDDDVDIGIFKAEQERFIEDVLPELIDEGFEYNHARTNFISLHRQGEKVDVCLYGKGLCEAGGLKDGSVLMPFVREFEPVTLGKKTFMVPQQEEYYEKLYGKNWKTPNKEYKHIKE